MPVNLVITANLQLMHWLATFCLDMNPIIAAATASQSLRCVALSARNAFLEPQHFR
jgi:hypothetical protein